MRGVLPASLMPGTLGNLVCMVAIEDERTVNIEIFISGSFCYAPDAGKLLLAFDRE